VKDEHPLLTKLRLTASALDGRLFRALTGQYWTGRIARHLGKIQILDASPVTVGFKGQSDLIGWVSVTITPEMVGSKVAVYAAVEAKTDNDRIKPEQTKFLQAVIEQGGMACEGREEADIDRMIREWKTRTSGAGST